MFSFLKSNAANSFYAVNKAQIKQAEEKMGLIIPEILKSFYEEVGYGFLCSKKQSINRILGPGSIAEFRMQTGQFANSDIAEELADYSSDKLVFFEVNESLYLSIGTAARNVGKVYYYDELIANDLKDFLKKYTVNENFFLD